MRGLFGHGAGLALAAASLVGMGVQVAPVSPGPEPERPRKRTRPTRTYRSSGSNVRPHNGAREIARRLRQAARDERRQRERLDAALAANRIQPWRLPQGACGLTRRGGIVVAVNGD